jgi:predicted CopG family antitoxin
MKGHNMTDFTKYKNITVDNSTYDNVTKLQGAIVPDMKISRSEVIRQLVKKEVKKQNGKLNDSKKR